MKRRDTFSSSTGFVLASAGAAIGLGNLWMFPWRLGQYGGAAFLLPYLCFVYVLGTTGLMGEFGLGRWGQKGAMGTFDKVLKTRGKSFGRLLGAYPVLATWGILLFYAIVAGWVLHYVFASISGAYLEANEVGTYFNQLAGQPRSILWQGLALGLTMGVLIFGIAKGIERVSKIITPLPVGSVCVADDSVGHPPWGAGRHQVHLRARLVLFVEAYHVEHGPWTSVLHRLLKRIQYGCLWQLPPARR